MQFTTVLAVLASLSTQGQAAPSSIVARQGFETDCTATYSVQGGDTCNKIRDQFNDVWSLEEFYKWNPQVNSFCSNLYPGEIVCVGKNDTSTIPPACPVPVQPGLVSNCKTCYQAVEFDNCFTIDEAYGITTDQFRLWNPSVYANCTNIIQGYNYCVGV